METGEFTIGSAFVKTKNKTYASNSVEITVGEKIQMTSDEVSTQQMSVPSFGIIQVNKTSIYEGEPILISAKIYSHSEPKILESYNSYSLDGGSYRSPLSSTNGIKLKRDQINEIDLFSFESDKNILYPIGNGDRQIDAFSATLNFGDTSFSFTSDFPQITIKPLPPNSPNGFCNAVGTFTVENQIGTEGFIQGDVFKVKMVITGQGNLMSIQRPKLVLPEGFVLYDATDVKEDYSYTNQGAEGSVTFEYAVIPLQHGNFVLPITTLSYFTVESEKYSTVSTEEISLIISENKNFDREAVLNEIKRKNEPSEMNLYLVMDVSHSMLAKDFKPNRLEAIKAATKDFIDQSKGDRIGLVFFAGETLSPYSNALDHDKLKREIDQINGDSLIGGTAIGDGLLKAVKQLEMDSAFSKVIILMTDGTNNSGTASPMLGASLSMSSGIRIYPIGVAGTEDALVPISSPFGTEYHNMQIEIEEKELIEIAELTGGKYFRALNESDLSSIFTDIRSIETKKRRK